MKERTDEELVHRCLEGNQEAWSSLIRRYRYLIYSVIRSYRVPDTDGADIFQAVCLELFNSLSRLRQVPALRRWLITVASHECLRWKRGSHPLGDCSTDVEILADANESHTLILLERQQMLREAMEDLSPRCRRMIELLFMQEPPIPYSDLASHLGLAVGSIGFIRRRCLSKLKTALEKLGFPGAA